MFSYCDSLTTIDLSNFNTQNVINMSSMFNGCHSLSNINLSAFNTQNVTNMRFMFAGCQYLSNHDEALLSDMFLGCNSLIKKYLV